MTLIYGIRLVSVVQDSYSVSDILMYGIRLDLLFSFRKILYDIDFNATTFYERRSRCGATPSELRAQGASLLVS